MGLAVDSAIPDEVLSRIRDEAKLRDARLVVL